MLAIGSNINIVDIYVRPIKKTLGILDHYFLVIDDWEYHLGGNYPLGEKLKKGTTKNAFVSKRSYVCQNCFKELQLRLESNEYRRVFKFFPIINCETLTVGLSIQSIVLAFGTISVLGLLYFKHDYLALVLFLVILLIVLIVSKYTLSRTHLYYCAHIKRLK